MWTIAAPRIYKDGGGGCNACVTAGAHGVERRAGFVGAIREAAGRLLLPPGVPQLAGL